MQNILNFSRVWNAKWDWCFSDMLYTELSPFVDSLT